MKILVIHASAGAGHTKAAEAVFQAVQKTETHSAVLTDALDHTIWFYKAVYRGSYAFLITRVSWLWGFFFWLLDVPCLQGLVRMLRRINNSFAGDRLEAYLKKEQFDVIISTHFFPSEVAAALKKKRHIHSRIFSVVTDYDVHRIWMAEEIDHYAVACDYTQKKLLSFGIGLEKITVSGIPVAEKFSKEVDRSLLRRQLGLRDDAFTVLLATGSFGIGPIEDIARRLTDCQVLVICGHNQELFARLNSTKNDLVKVYGLVDNMDEMMAVSDCLITKPGGLSISEALVKGLPLIFFNAIPGQEAHNIRVLASYGVGVHPRDIQEIISQVAELRSSKDALNRGKHRIARLARPRAANDIVSLLLK